jgi:hypothetical protein
MHERSIIEPSGATSQPGWNSRHPQVYEGSRGASSRACSVEGQLRMETARAAFESSRFSHLTPLPLPETGGSD